MKAATLNFSQMLRQMKNDPMLLVLTFVPVLMGLFFRFGIPFVEIQVTSYFALEYVISPYYGLFDLFLVIATPTMFNFVVAMVVLEERDERIISYLAVTPLGKKGYLFSRFGITGILSLALSISVFALFHLVDMKIGMLMGLAVISAVQSIGTAMMIVTFSANKVEGMAIGKLTSLVTLGVLAPFFIEGKLQYIFCGLPSFWLAKAVKESNYILLVIALLVVVVWIVLLIKKFIRKVF